MRIRIPTSRGLRVVAAHLAIQPGDVNAQDEDTRAGLMNYMTEHMLLSAGADSAIGHDAMVVLDAAARLESGNYLSPELAIILVTEENHCPPWRAGI